MAKRYTAFVALALVMLLFAACRDGDDAVTGLPDTVSENESLTDVASQTECETTPETEAETGAAYTVYPMKSADAPANDAANSHRFPQSKIAEGMEINGTYIGKDGWMFYKDSLDDYKGVGLYPESAANSIKDRMTQRLEWLNEQGIKLYFVIAPNKNSVYPEYMPDEFTMGDYRRIDQTVELLESVGVNVIDGRVPMLAAKEADPGRLMYYKLDTHWNNYGGYLVYQALMDRICADFPNAVRRTEDEYDITYMETYMKDQAYNIGYYSDYIEEGPQYTLLSGKTALLTRREEKDRWGQFRFSYEYPDGYSDHLYSFGFDNEHIPDAPSIYVIRDSFGIALTYFLKDSFSTSDYSWTTRFDRSAISSKKPDILIIEVAERHINDYFSMRTFSD